MNNMSSFKKSVLSIVFMSAVTGSLISWDKYQPRHETQSLVEFYESRDFASNFVFLEDIDYSSKHSNKNAIITAEEQRLIEAELMAQSLAENIYTREADAIYLHENGETFKTAKFVEPSTNNSEEIEQEKRNEIVSSKADISEKVFFTFDSSEVADSYMPLLNKTAHLMQSEANDSKIWQIVGYADVTGNNIYNDKLAYQRAQSVTEYLVNKGVQEDKLMIISLGESQSKQSLLSVDSKRLARRVEIHDYDNLVAIRAEKFNQQIKEEMINQKKSSIAQLKTQPVINEPQQQEIAISEIEKETNQSITDNKFEFSSQQKDSLATVMKL